MFITDRCQNLDEISLNFRYFKHFFPEYSSYHITNLNNSISMNLFYPRIY